MWTNWQKKLIEKYQSPDILCNPFWRGSFITYNALIVQLSLISFAQKYFYIFRLSHNNIITYFNSIHFNILFVILFHSLNFFIETKKFENIIKRYKIFAHITMFFIRLLHRSGWKFERSIEKIAKVFKLDDFIWHAYCWVWQHDDNTIRSDRYQIEAIKTQLQGVVSIGVRTNWIFRTNELVSLFAFVTNISMMKLRRTFNEII